MPRALAPKRLNVLIVDDHAVVREALAMVIRDAFAQATIETATDAGNALALLGRVPVDIVITDLSMPGMSGLDLVEHLRRRHGRTRAIVISMHDEAHFALRAYRAGADAYLSKDEAAECLVDAMRKVLAGGTFVTARTAEQLARRMGAPTPTEGTDELADLADHELDLLQRLVGGQDLAAIAAAVHRSPKTVARRRAALRRKLALPNTAALIRFGIEHGLNAADGPEA